MTVTVAGDPVVFHVLPVGGGTVVFSALPGVDGAYEADLDHLISWRPALVLSVVTPAELVALGAEGLGQSILDHGARWQHLMIGTGDVLQRDAQEDWPGISMAVRKALLGGGRVMVHSPQGAGRAGMIVLRLMIEAGEAPDEAQERLRSVHAPAMGNADQLSWAMQAQREAARFVRHRRAQNR